MTTLDGISTSTEPVRASDETAGHAIVRTLEEHGIARTYIVPGESYLDVLDGLYGSSLETIVCRHEGGAAYMAEAEGKLGRLPGIAMVTRGPGAANAHVGLHTAWQDSTPMILFVGLIPLEHRGREAFQEFDIQSWFDSGAKEVFVLDSAQRASELVAEAIFTARSGRPGPVVVGLPEDVLTGRIPERRYPELPVAGGGLTRRDAESLKEALEHAERPLFVTGGNDWDDADAFHLTQWLERHHIAAAAEWRTEGIVPFDSPSYVGPIGYGRPKPTADLLDEADLLVYIGTVPGDVLTAGFLARQGWNQRNILVSIDTQLRGRSGAVTLHIVARPGRFVRDLLEADITTQGCWEDWTRVMRAQQEDFSTLPSAIPSTGPAQMDTLMAHLVPKLDRSAVVTFGAGEHTNWAHRYFPAAHFSSMLSAGNGSMGYSVPAAITASLNFPHRQIICIAGDGEFLMNGQELATAAQYGARPLIIVMDNREYGTIRTHQERHYPGRVVGTQLRNPDFARLAEAFGGTGIRVERDAEVPAALDHAFNSIESERRFALIHLVVEQRRQAY